MFFHYVTVHNRLILRKLTYRPKSTVKICSQAFALHETLNKSNLQVLHDSAGYIYYPSYVSRMISDQLVWESQNFSARFARVTYIMCWLQIMQRALEHWLQFLWYIVLYRIVWLNYWVTIDYIINMLLKAILKVIFKIIWIKMLFRMS